MSGKFQPEWMTWRDRAARPGAGWRTARLECCEAREMLAVAPTPPILVDVNTLQSSNPRELTEFAGRLYFVADHEEYGAELFSTDGTAEGTSLVADLKAGKQGSSPSHLVVSGDLLYFATAETQVWRTDGTTAGTIQVFFDSYGSLTDQFEMTAADQGVYLFEHIGYRGLWKVGAEVGTAIEIGRIDTNGLHFAKALTSFRDRLYFIGNDSKIWSARASYLSAQLALELPPGSGSPVAESLQVFGDSLYFVTRGDDGSSLWRSDGTTAGTRRVALFGEIDIESLQTRGEQFYFLAGEPGAIKQLWQSDGTADGTRLVVSALPIAGSQLTDLMITEQRLYYVQSFFGQLQLWSSSGAAGNSQFVSLLPANVEIARPTAELDGDLFFYARQAPDAWELWSIHGTSVGPAGLENVRTAQLLTLAGRLYSVANQDLLGFELWSTADSAQPPQLVIDLPSPGTDSSEAADFQLVGSRLFFTADDGRSLWTSDLTRGNATKLWEFSELESTLAIDEQLYVVARDKLGQVFLGVTDGTLARTRKIDLSFAPAGLQISNLTNVGGAAWFTLNERSIGTLLCFVESDEVRTAVNLGFINYWHASSSAVVDDRMIFLGPGNLGPELWVTDGTSAGTQMLRPNLAYTELRDVSFLTVVGPHVYFLGREFAGNSDLWRTDGTVAGTKKFASSSANATITNLMAVGDWLYYALGTTLRRFNPATSVGEVVATDVLPLLLPGRSIAALDENVYYLTKINETESGFWRANLSNEKVLLATLPKTWTGVGNMLAQDGILYFRHMQSLLYRSDGTAAGTFELQVPYPQLPDGLLHEFLVGVGGKLYFPYAGELGTEPAVLDSRTTVLDQRLFYSGSSFDTSGPDLGAGDAAATATDKVAYFAGSGQAGFENISSYLYGITGLKLDFNFLAQDLLPEDFQFRIGGSNALEEWTAAPAPAAMRIERASPGKVGSQASVYFSWPNDAIRNTWLEVTVLATERSGLSAPHVFYFGSRVGDTGSGSADAAITSAHDELAVRYGVQMGVGVTHPLDFNRNGRVNMHDALIARNNGGILLKLDLPATGSAAPLVTSIENDLADIAAQSLDAPLVTQPLAAAAVRTSPSRGELLAYAAQAWSEWLDVEDEFELIGTLPKASRSRC